MASRSASGKDWEGSSRAAVDAALIGRFYERYADHCVNVGARIVYRDLANIAAPDPLLLSLWPSQGAKLHRLARDLRIHQSICPCG